MENPKDKICSVNWCHDPAIIGLVVGPDRKIWLCEPCYNAIKNHFTAK